MSSYGEHELLPTNQWATETNGIFILNDPFSGAQLDPNTPPDFLMENPRLRDGQHFLGQPTLAETTVGVLHANGERFAEDLGAAEFENVLSDPRYDVQAVGHAVDGTQRMNNGLLMMPSGPHQPFIERIEHAANTYGLASYCVGLEIDDVGRPASRTERALSALRQTVQRAIVSDNQDRGLWAASLEAVSDNIHQWYRVLSAEEQLAQLSLQSQRAGGLALQNAVLVSSVKDLDYSRKFEATGLGIIEPSLVNLDNLTEHQLWRAKVMATSQIVPDIED